MAAENYIRDISAYLTAGNLSDLTLNFGQKSWQTHKALACCHSKWFRKAITVGFEETDSGVITLKDDPELANAVDCMVSYFYEAGYNASKYDTSEPLLHAQVATIADKYDCTSLYELARISFANTVNAVESDDWIAIAALIYDYTTPELLAHVELRKLVIAAVADRPAVLWTILRKDSMVELLRSSADLATDLLLAGLHKPKVEDVSKHIFMCDNCQYVHAGPRNCSYVESMNTSGMRRSCPKCWKSSGATSKRYTHKVDLLQAFPCASCNGIHTADPEPEPEPVPEPHPWTLNVHG